MQNRKWYHNDSEERLIEANEIPPKGWRPGRLPKVTKLDLMIQSITKEDLYKYYIIENHSFVETEEKFLSEIGGKLNQLLKYYGIRKDPKKAALNNTYKRSHESYVLGGKKSAETQKVNWSNKSEEEKQAWSEFRSNQMNNRSQEEKDTHIRKIKEYWNNLSQEQKDEINKRRSEACKQAYKDGTLINKIHEIKRQNREDRKSELICRSLSEQKVFDALKSIYPDTLYDVKVDERYPYFVDFYIPSLDLFIEWNAHPSHGNFPYEENDSDCIRECYNLHGDWLETYIRRDPEKINQAKKMMLNYLTLYPGSSTEKNYSINENRYCDIIDLILQ